MDRKLGEDRRQKKNEGAEARNRMSREDIFEMAHQIDAFATSWNQCSTKRLPYKAIHELRNFLIEYFTDEEESEE